MNSSTRLQQLFTSATQCAAQGDFAQAAAIFRQATEVDAKSFAAWCNLAAMYAELNQAEEAAAAARQAIALQPNFGPAWANLGDALRLTGRQADASFEAYRRAAALMPNSAETLNKLGATLHIRGQFSDSATVLRRALLLAPSYREARINLVTTLMSLQRAEDARTVLAEGTRLPGLPPEALSEWRSGLSLLDENLRLRPLLAKAVDQADPEMLVEAVAARGCEAPIDEALVTTIQMALRKTPIAGNGFSAWRPELADTWYAVEAHFSAHLGETADSIKQSRSLLAAAVAGSPAAAARTYRPEERDALAYYLLCRRFSGGIAAGHGTPSSPQEANAWLRLLHAQLTWHRPENTPGEYKVVANSVSANPWAIRTPPAAVAGTVGTLFLDCYRTATPGPLRAALVYFAIADIHPFPDGNGRLGRWLMNRELEAAGLCPVVYAGTMKRDFHHALWAIRRDQDFGPFVRWLADCDAYTQDIVNRLNA